MSKYIISPEEKKMLRKIFKRSFHIYGSGNMASMTSVGYAQSIIPAIEMFHKDEEEKRKALVRAQTFFNCTYETAPFIMGINAAMEKQKANVKDFDDSSINAVKVSLMGPLSGIGDSLFWGVVRLLAASIALPLAAKGNIVGPILFLLLYNVPSILTRYNLLYLGYTTGEKFLNKLYNSGIMKRLTTAFGIVGLIMIGALSAQFVTISTPLTFTFSAGETIVVQEILDSILKGLLPLTVVITCFLLHRKKVNMSKMLIGIIIIAILGAFIGIL